jgi:hypothetical protein
MSQLVDALVTHCRQVELPDPTPELRFDARRRWRFDLAWPEQRIAAECHGSTWTNGRHVRGDGFEGDRRKMNAAQLQGWRVFEFTRAMIDSGEAVDTLADAIRGK